LARHSALGWSMAAVVLAAAGTWAGWAWRVPRAVRTLPAGNALFYIDLAPMRQAGILSLGGSQPLGAPYSAFVRDSGFEFERDLDQVAISMQGSVVKPEQTTAVLVGRFTPQLDGYFGAHALRKTAVAGCPAYQFPGWARPNQPLTVVELGSDRLLVTNAGDPATVMPGWLPHRPPLWKHGFWSLPPLGYASAEVTSTDAQLPEGMRGGRSWDAEIKPGTDGGLVVNARFESDDAADAAASLNWFQSQVRQFAPLLDADAGGGPSVRALLDHLVLAQHGSTVALALDLDPTTLAQWRKALAQGR